MKRLHDKHGGLLFRESTSPNGKLWVDSARLADVWPHRFGAVPPTAADVTALRSRLEKAEETAERALLSVEELRRELEELRCR